jgi:hypothetical protein
MSGQIFISYRREDSPAWVRLLSERLRGRFSSEKVFMDVDSLDAGVDFVEAIEQSVGSCDVLIAVIGRQWLSSSDAEGKRRLEKPDDYVRIEIATALKNRIRVIPVLVDRALMPRSDELPEELKTLTRRNALEVSHHRFSADSEQLIAALEGVLEKTTAEQQEREKRRELEESERLAAQQRENERREKDRLDAERLEAECQRGLEAEQRQRENSSDAKTVPSSTAPAQDRGPTQAKIRPTIQSKASTNRKRPVYVIPLMVFAVILIVAQTWWWYAGFGLGTAQVKPTPQSIKPTPQSTATPATAVTPTEKRIADGTHMKQVFLAGDRNQILAFLQSNLANRSIHFTAQADDLHTTGYRGKPVYRFSLFPQPASLPTGQAAVAVITYRMDHPSFRDPLLVTRPANGFKGSYDGWGCLEQVVALIEYVDPDRSPEIAEFDMCKALGDGF